MVRTMKSTASLARLACGTGLQYNSVALRTKASYPSTAMCATEQAYCRHTIHLCLLADCQDTIRVVGVFWVAWCLTTAPLVMHAAPRATHTGC